MSGPLAFKSWDMRPTGLGVRPTARGRLRDCRNMCCTLTFRQPRSRTAQQQPAKITPRLRTSDPLKDQCSSKPCEVARPNTGSCKARLEHGLGRERHAPPSLGFRMGLGRRHASSLRSRWVRRRSGSMSKVTLWAAIVLHHASDKKLGAEATLRCKNR